MSKGKIAVQVAHGEVYYMKHIIDILGDYGITKAVETFGNWYCYDDNLMKKAVLKASGEQVADYHVKLEVRHLWSKLVYDKGLTQVPEDSLTCLVVEPLPEEQYNGLFGHLKLL